MKQAVGIIYFIFILVLGLASLYGVMVPQNSPSSIVETMQVSSFKDGISLYQINRDSYYTDSPYNDYFLDQNDNRVSFLPKETVINNNYLSNFHKSHLVDIKQAIEGYFRLITPSISYQIPGEKEIRYTTVINQNTINIDTNVTNLTNFKPLKIGSTLLYSAVDFIFDSQGNLYTYKTEDDIAEFNSQFGLTLVTKPEEARVEIPDRVVFIVNPTFSSILVIRANNYQTLWVNRSARLIEVEQSAMNENNNYKNTITVEVYKNLSEAFKAL